MIRKSFQTLKWICGEENHSAVSSYSQLCGKKIWRRMKEQKIGAVIELVERPHSKASSTAIASEWNGLGVQGQMWGLRLSRLGRIIFQMIRGDFLAFSLSVDVVEFKPSYIWFWLEEKRKKNCQLLERKLQKVNPTTLPFFFSLSLCLFWGRTQTLNQRIYISQKSIVSWYAFQVY